MVELKKLNIEIYINNSMYNSYNNIQILHYITIGIIHGIININLISIHLIYF